MMEITNKKEANTDLLNSAMEYNTNATVGFIRENYCTSIEQVAEKLRYQEVIDFVVRLDKGINQDIKDTEEFKDGLAQDLYDELIESYDLVCDIVTICEQHYNYNGEVKDADEVATWLSRRPELIGYKHIQHDCLCEATTNYFETWGE